MQKCISLALVLLLVLSLAVPALAQHNPNMGASDEVKSISARPISPNQGASAPLKAAVHNNFADNGDGSELHYILVAAPNEGVLVTSGGVQVASMTVTGGDFTISGGNIVSNPSNLTFSDSLSFDDQSFNPGQGASSSFKRNAHNQLTPNMGHQKSGDAAEYTHRTQVGFTTMPGKVLESPLPPRAQTTWSATEGNYLLAFHVTHNGGFRTPSISITPTSGAPIGNTSFSGSMTISYAQGDVPISSVLFNIDHTGVSYENNTLQAMPDNADRADVSYFMWIIAPGNMLHNPNAVNVRVY